jgi:SAM-dependent methyltransferase
MTNDDYTEKNRAAWNEAQPYHTRGRKNDLFTQFANPDYLALNPLELEALGRVGLQGKNIAHICCNNGVELISMLRLGAAHGTGFDIADAFIEEAAQLAQFTGVNADFVRTNALEIPAEYNGQYDLVVFTIGALLWIKDLPGLFAVVRRLLKPGGALYIYEMHPMLNLFAEEGEPGFDPNDEMKIVFPYFNQEPWVETSGIDYIGGTTYDGLESVCFAHTTADILGAIINAGFILTRYEEFPQDISMAYKRLEKYNKIPMSYLLTARVN